MTLIHVVPKNRERQYALKELSSSFKTMSLSAAQQQSGQVLLHRGEYRIGNHQTPIHHQHSTINTQTP
ncbi:hypothetical protein MC7420_7592 [Coleofasciculus chthonoplastes PCC 7420]|uniref:Uncharacterized protein n=1 Tax=Coleofasciculus chthonoplastes PCC 7420 TaxID=118168 RepID=B4W1A9_9CYAN|nr:hypothetical protein MC7420_7592 [Coleofasciculus chthonoplastes PCC 7420]